jgi:hypothetical protein
LIQKLSPLTQLTHCLGIPIYWNWLTSQAGATTKNAKSVVSQKYYAVIRRWIDICCLIVHKVLDLHVVDNAFFMVLFWNNPWGIFGATPIDPMHAFETFHICWRWLLILSLIPTTRRNVWMPR